MLDMTIDDFKKHYQHTWVIPVIDGSEHLGPHYVDGTDGAAVAFSKQRNGEITFFHPMKDLTLKVPQEQRLVEFDGAVFLYTRNGKRQWKIGYCSSTSSITRMDGHLLHYGFRGLIIDKTKKYKQRSTFFIDLDVLVDNEDVRGQVFARVPTMRTISSAINVLSIEKRCGCVLRGSLWISISPNDDNEYFIFHLETLIAKVSGKTIHVFDKVWRQEIKDYLNRHETGEYSLEGV